MAKSRWELEENRKKRQQQAQQQALAALKSGAAFKGNAVQDTVSSAAKNNFAQSSTAKSTIAKAGSKSSAQKSTAGGRSRNLTNTIRPDTTARTLPRLNSLSSLSGSTERRSGGFSGGGGAGTRLPRVGDTTRAQRAADYDQMTQNSVRWHFAGDEEREELKRENDKIRAAYGLTYNPRSGRTFAGNTDLSRDVGDRVQNYRDQGVLSTIGHNTGAGIAGINQAAYSTLDFLLPDVITPDFMQDYIDEAKKNSEDIQQKVDNYNYGRGGKIGGMAGDLYQSAIEMAPQAVIALMTGNLSTGAQLADTGKNAVSKVVQQLTKSPAAWASFFQTVGSDYEEAKANGANDLEAAASAIISSGINAGVEMSGGLETAGARPRNILNWLKGMNEEGREEVVQGVVSGLTQKGIYDADRPWLTTGSGEGVIDPVRMAQEYGAGALLGGVMTAPGTFTGRRSAGAQAAQETAAAPRVENYSPVMQETVRDIQAQIQETPQETAQPTDSQAFGQTYTGMNDFTAPLTQTLVKIDEQMRIAENLPAGPVRENRIQALREGAQEVSRQLAAIENNRTEFTRAQTIAERFGAKFALADLGPAGGKYENGTITINPYSSSPVRQVLVHELTHHLETSGQYDALQRQALGMFAAEQGVDVDTLRNNITQLYAQNGVQLDADGADRELTAAFCENRLFTDEASVQRLAQTDRSLFERIRQWIADAVARLRGTPEQREMLRLQQMYERAARTAGQREGYRGAQYSIDGRSTLAAQRAYREAVERGDTQTAEEILRQRYQTKGYSPNIDNRMMHAAPNSRDGYSARFDDLTPMYGDDIYGPHAEDYFGTGESYDGAAIAAIQNAKNNPNGLVTVYRAIPSGVPDSVLRNGDWVTTVEDYAREHGERTLEGAYRIIEETVPARYLYGNGDSIFEFGYDNGNNEVYRNAVGNAKTAGVTYDDYGDLIPLSQRFDERNPDRRYTFGFTPEQIATAPEVQVPLSSAIRYGATPQQAMNEAKVKEAGRIRQALREAHRNIVSGQAEIERFARAQDRTNPKAVNANDLAQINRAANSTVDTIAGTALVDRKGDTIGGSWVDVVGDLTPEQIEQLTLYRLHKHNVDRMSLFERTQDARTEAAMEYDAFLNENPIFNRMTDQAVEDWRRNGTPGEQALAEEYLALKERLNALQGIHNKPVIAKVSDDGMRDEPYTAEESENIVREMEAQNPKLREWAEKAEQFHDEFMQEWAVGSGLMSQEQYDMLKERYPHYVQTYRVQDNWGGGADTTRRGTVNTGSPIKEAVGDLGEIIPFEDAEMMQVNTIVKNARRNELFRNIYDFAKANPAAAAPYVRVVGEDAEYSAPESIDDLTGRISDAAMSDAGGIYTIRAMVDGKPVTMQVNSAFYAGLQNLFRQDKGASDTFMKRVVGPVTTGFKRVTTGDNPFFAATNLAKDAQTAYFNTISKRKLAVTYMYDAVRSAAHMAQNADDWKAFSALGGKSSTFYDNNKGFEKSLEISKRNKKGIRKALNTVHGWVTFLNENAEAVWRFNEYRAGIERYGDTPEGRAKAIQAAADVTTNFSRSGPTAKSFDTFVPYLNASIQGLDKTARQIKNHPFTTTRRALELITLPTLVLWMINKDDEDYQNLNNRTKDNYFCVPAAAFDFIAKPLGLETEGKFIKIPKSREYGVAFGAAFERALRAWVQGEDIKTAFKGLGSQLMTNLAPSNPVTDNIFKNIFIDLPTNRDFAGRAIVPERMQGLSPENQYDYSTSGAGRTLANIWNTTVGRGLGKVSPIQVDYLIDSNLGFIGDAIIGATTQPKSPQQMIEEIRSDPVGAFFAPILNTLEQKFVADPMYQSGVTDAFYDELNAAEMAKNDKNLVEGLAADIVTPEEKYYSELLKASSEMSELRKQERALMADTSLTDDEREEQVRAIRRQINDIAKAAPENARKVREEYEKTYVPEISYLSESRYADAQEALKHGVTGQQFAQWDKRLSEMIGEKDENDKKVRTEAEARNIVLDEVMQDSTLSDSEKQALADYVLISSIGEEDEKARKNWETIAKGKVNASDFVRFQADASVYDAWAEGTGTDNAANVAEILRGYDGLTDEQRDVLFQTYRDNMSVNPFHVSVYEKSIDPNGSFYGALTDDGKARLRSLLNEYEQDINEGAELDEWRAKAYMAEKEAGISPATYAMYRVALETANTDDKGNPRQSEAEACVNAMDGLTQYQKAYLYASTNKSWKNNPFGSATVGEYSSGQEVGINPVAGATVTSRFGPRKSFQTDNGAMSSSLHPSIDIGAAEGTPIGAYKSGKVTQNGWVDGYGWTIEVTHSDGTVSAYHHMMEQSPVAVGTEVKQGEQIGKVGQTGNSKGAHLDLTITRDGKPIDPATLIPELQDSATGYVWTGSNVYTNVTSGSGQDSSGSSGGSSGSSGLKSLDNLLKLDGLF